MSTAELPTILEGHIKPRADKVRIFQRRIPAGIENELQFGLQEVRRLAVSAESCRVLRRGRARQAARSSQAAGSEPPSREERKFHPRRVNFKR